MPANDPTLLFTNAGMVQFKDVFLGVEKRPYVRAASSQRCVRAGGKHNDLENVGYTGRHHTFFEMLGNFSFGDYFKREAIGFAWEFLTQELKLPKDKLWVTIYKDDDEAADIWLKRSASIRNALCAWARPPISGKWATPARAARVPRCFTITDRKSPGPPGSPDEDGDRYVEIWNLVFMQFNRDAKGKLTKLPKPSVDTGMGLERIAAVQQGCTAITTPTCSARSSMTPPKPSAPTTARAIRSTSSPTISARRRFSSPTAYCRRTKAAAMCCGAASAAPSATAIASAREAFFYKLVAPLVREMGAAYPELARAQAHVEGAAPGRGALRRDLEQGLRILDQDIAALTGDTIAGAVIFKLYDTYGFPVDLTRDVALERNLKIDMAGFEREMEAQRERARAASTFKSVIAVGLDERRTATDFTGYAATRDEAKVEAIRVGDKDVLTMTAGQEGVVYLDRTPFYAESGGQVGDQGRLTATGVKFAVLVTRKGHAHVGRLERR